VIVNQQLVKYVKQNLSSGYSAAVLRQTLINSGYNAQDVDAALNIAQGYQQQYAEPAQPETVQETLQQTQSVYASPQLVQYIQQLLGQNYDINYIRSYLIKYGYQSNMIDSAINAASPQQAQQTTQPIVQQQTEQAHVKHTIHFSPGVIVAIFMILAVVGIATYFAPALFGQKAASPPSTLLDLSLEPVKTSLQPGNTLEFTHRIDNLGAQIRYDIKLTHKIIDSKTNDVVTEKSETVAIETRGITTARIKLPDDIEPGRYTLETTAIYDSQEAKASFSFKVYKESTEATCFDNTRNQGELGIDCGGPCDEPCPTCTDSLQNGEETGIDCGGSCSPCPEADCFDGIENGDEEGVDCGGSCPLECRTGTCTDGQLSPGEEGIDCDGVCPRPCSTIGTPVQGLSKREIMDKAEKIAEVNEQDAISLCRQLEKQSDQDSCLAKIAEITENINYCGLLSSDAKRDNCYMGFATRNDYTGCAEITSRIMMQSCNSLARAHLVNQYMREGREDELRRELGMVVNETPGLGTGRGDILAMPTIGTKYATAGSPFFEQITASHTNPFAEVAFSDDTELFDINSASGVISFTPTAEQAGEHAIIIEATDGELIISEEMTLIIAGPEG